MVNLILIGVGILALVWLFTLLEGVLLPLVAMIVGVLVLLDLAHGGTVIRGVLDQIAAYLANLINTFLGGFKL